MDLVRPSLLHLPGLSFNPSGPLVAATTFMAYDIILKLDEEVRGA